MKHTHWTIVAYDEINEQGNYMHPVDITINDAINENWALDEAKRMVLRKHHTLRGVRECTTCKIQKKQEKFIDKMLKREEE